ncbi:MAG TPA: hypothetical protein VGL99_15970 [Chloroflexota bacterium]
MTLEWVLVAQCDWPRATKVLTTALAQASELGDMILVIESLELLAAVAAGLGHATQAVRLNGAALALREAGSTPRPRITEVRLQHGLSAVHRGLSRHKIALALGAGRMLSFDAAVAEGLRQPRPAGPALRPVTRDEPLSPRERQVAGLLARGLYQSADRRSAHHQSWHRGTSRGEHSQETGLSLAISSRGLGSRARLADPTGYNRLMRTSRTRTTTLNEYSSTGGSTDISGDEEL